VNIVVAADESRFLFLRVHNRCSNRCRNND
jgi:hypothetical protein